MNLDDFLANSDPARPGRKCCICSNEQAAADAQKIADGFADGSISHTVNHLWEKFFRPTHGVKCANTLRKHLRSCLNADI